MGFDYSHFFNEEEEPKDEFLEQQYKEFVEVVRTYLLILLLVSILCFIASYIISYFQNVDLNSEVCLLFVHPIPIAYSIMSWDRFLRPGKTDLPTGLPSSCACLVWPLPLVSPFSFQ